MFINIFFIQKSKSSTNLNHREGKEEEAIIDKSTMISDSWEKYILCIMYPWHNFCVGGEGATVFLGAIM